MARIADHPLRLARIKAGLSQNELAKRAGVHRSALTAIEDGRTKKPTDRLVETLAAILDVPAYILTQEIQAWLAKPRDLNLRPSARNLLIIPPYTLNQYYQTFAQWRKEVSPTPTAFASLLQVNPKTVSDYESGKTSKMPDVLASKLINVLGMQDDYLVALEGLPRGD